MTAEAERREPGWCQSCGAPVAAGLIIAEEHGASGPGRTAVVCREHEPSQGRPALSPGWWSQAD